MQKFHVPKVADDSSDDVKFELISSSENFYRHPAPSAPEAVERDTARLDYLQQSGSTIDLVGASLSFRVGGLSPAINVSIRETIDKAMLAAGGD